MKDLKSAILLFILFTIICGGAYPALVTGLAKAFFPSQAQGSMVTDQDGREIGSRLIGQPFSADNYFWPRPSATADFSNNPLASGGSNISPTNPAFLKGVEARIQKLRESGVSGPIPADLIMASGSGLDPEISPEAARLQIPRVAKARGVSPEKVAALVERHRQGRQFSFLGAERVNVLLLNLALERL